MDTNSLTRKAILDQAEYLKMACSNIVSTFEMRVEFQQFSSEPGTRSDR